MRVVFGKASDFKEMISSISRNLDEIPFNINDGGLSAKALSEDKTTMVILRVPAESFDVLELEGPVKFKVKSTELIKILKRSSRGDSLEFSLEGENLLITFHNEKQKVKRSFSVTITSRDIEEVGEPKVELPIEASMISKDLKEITDDVKKVGGEVKLIFDKGELKVMAESTGRRYIAILKESAPLLSLKSTIEKAESKYSVDLLYSVVRGIPSNGTVVLSFGEQLPLRLFADLEKLGSLIYWIAPTT
jgi:proliferating cell nuclear antigen